MKKTSLILVFLLLLISCSKIQEKKKIGINNNNRFRMTQFTEEDIPRFTSLYGEGPIYERMDEKISDCKYRCEDVNDGGADSAVYMKNNFIYTTGNFYKHREDKKFLTYFLNITDKKIAKFIPEGVAIRFFKKFDFNRDGKMDYFVLFSYPVEFDDLGLHEEIILYIILSHKNGYSLQYKSREGTSIFSFIVDVNVYKNKYLFMSKIGLGRTLSTFFELYWYQ